MVKKWNLNNRASLVVTDNAANMVLAVRESREHWKHSPCFAHTLNLSVQSAWAEPNIKSVIQKVRGKINQKRCHILNLCCDVVCCTSLVYCTG